MVKSWLAVAIGSVIGGLLRWAIGLRLNSAPGTFQAGTLAVNLTAGFLVGLAAAHFLKSPLTLPMEWRLFVITGFCGGLSTFSTFSLDVVTLLGEGRLGLAFATIGMHVGGSLLMTFVGILTYSNLRI